MVLCQLILLSIIIIAMILMFILKDGDLAQRKIVLKGQKTSHGKDSARLETYDPS